MDRHFMVILALCCYLGHVSSLEETRATNWDISLLTESTLIRLTENKETGAFSINKTRLEAAIHQYRRAEDPLYANPVNLIKLAHDHQAHVFFILDASSSTVFAWNETDGTITLLLKRQGISTIEYDPCTQTLYSAHLEKNAYIDLFTGRVYMGDGHNRLSLKECRMVYRLPIRARSVKLAYQRNTQDLIIAINTPEQFRLFRLNTAGLRFISLSEQSSPTMNGYHQIPISLHEMVRPEDCIHPEYVRSADNPCFSFHGCQLIDMDWNDDLLFLLTYCPDDTTHSILVTNITETRAKEQTSWIVYNHSVDKIKKMAFGRDYYLSYRDNRLFSQKTLRIVAFNGYAIGENKTAILTKRSSIKRLKLMAPEENLTGMLIRHKFPNGYCLFKKTIGEKGKQVTL